MEYWIWLSQLPGIGPISQKKLLAFFGGPLEIYLSSLPDLLEVDGIGEQTAKKIIEFRIDHVAGIIKQVERLRINVRPYENRIYSEVFSCKRSPVLFYYIGKLPEKRGVAIVGARRCTHDAKRATEEIASLLAGNGVAVISGLAKGIDSYAHTTCLKVGGYTMAVLANGVDICYPKEHKRLYEQIIADGGAVLSSYPPGVKPHPKYFVERNAHISAWSTDVIVVQASEKSGSLTTARFALEQNRNLYAVPHSINLPEAKGSNQLLASGARIYTGPESLAHLGIKNNPNVHAGAPIYSLTQFEENIVTHLRKVGNCSFSELSHHLKVPELELTPTILQLEMHNILKIRGTTISCR
ncbi:DNA-processing protein DprA [Anaerobacillus isosaccharinicus]|uniref:DNA-protecting protein DprA n=1 Tax=Anaerobacillus isosaccharinicus TaxID=1532552 RepID=A0A1S2L9D5_9BACI|nr:DNA-processing protein DprA [Anaerobacillus isosaccharinicus]MBA5584625.1 DNA-protecting protein DprA [Anaerobacillus isosaccharinicus]QOY36999.1 DNA-protecting protein DprA [Anaerobacillus isosaccharinicus]